MKSGLFNICAAWFLSLLPLTVSGINYDSEIVQPASYTALQSVKDVIEIISYSGSVLVSTIYLLKNKPTLKKWSNFFDKMRNR